MKCSSRTDEVATEESKKEKQKLNAIRHRWIDHVLRHNDLLYKITEGRMNGKPTRERLQMLHDLTNGDGCALFKRAAINNGWKYSGMMSETKEEEVCYGMVRWRDGFFSYRLLTE